MTALQSAPKRRSAADPSAPPSATSAGPATSSRPVCVEVVCLAYQPGARRLTSGTRPGWNSRPVCAASWWATSTTVSRALGVAGPGEYVRRRALRQHAAQQRARRCRRRRPSVRRRSVASASPARRERAAERAGERAGRGGEPGRLPVAADRRLVLELGSRPRCSSICASSSAACASPSLAEPRTIAASRSRSSRVPAAIVTAGRMHDR